MAFKLNDDVVLGHNAALSNTWRNRIVAFAPIAVALIGIGVMAVAGPGERGTMIGSADGIDPVLTGSVAPGGSIER